MSPEAGQNLIAALGEICASHSQDHHEGTVQPLLEEIRSQLTQVSETMQGKIVRLEQALNESKAHALSQNASLTGKIDSLEHALTESKAHASSLENLTNCLQKQVQMQQETTLDLQKQTSDMAESRARDLVEAKASHEHHEQQGKEIRQEMDEALASLEKVSQAQMQAMQEEVSKKASDGAMQQLQETVCSLDARICEVERASSDVKAQSAALEETLMTRASSEELHSMRKMMLSSQQDLDKKVSTTEQAMQQKMDEGLNALRDDVKKVDTASKSLGTQLESAQTELVDVIGDVQKLSSNVTSVQTNVTSCEARASKVEETLVTKASVQDVNDRTWRTEEDMKEKFLEMQGLIQLKLDVSRFDELKADVKTQTASLEQAMQARTSAHEVLDDRVTNCSKTLSQLEAATENLGKSIETVKHDLGERTSQSEMQNTQLSGAVTGLRADVANVEQALLEKASAVDVRNLQASVSIFDGSWGTITTDLATLKTTNDSLQELQKKVSGSEIEIQDLSTKVTTNERRAEDNVTAIWQAVKLKLDSDMFLQIDGEIKAQAHATEKALQGKVGARDLDAINETIQSNQQLLTDKMGKVEHSMEKKMNEALLGLEEQLVDASRALQDKANTNQIRQVKDVLDCLQSQCLATETAMSRKLDTTRFDQAVQLKADLHDVQHLEQLLKGVQQQVVQGGSCIRDTEDLRNAIAAKADKAYVDQEIQSKAGEVYVNADFDKKRLKAYVDAEMQKKADMEYITIELDKRPLKEEVANGIMAVLQTPRP